MSEVTKDPIGKILVGQIQEGIKAINEANTVLLEDETGTPIRDIDKALKSTDTVHPDNIKAFWEKAEEARKVYKENLDNARNLYRTEVLGEEAKEDNSDVDVASIKETRKVVMDALQFLTTYATQNGKAELVEFANTTAVPQVGRQGSSIVGSKKPRVFVKVVKDETETVYESFSLAAVALSSKESKVTASDLAEAWNAANGGTEGTFSFKDAELTVAFKGKKSDA